MLEKLQQNKYDLNPRWVRGNNGSGMQLVTSEPLSDIKNS